MLSLLPVYAILDKESMMNNTVQYIIEAEDMMTDVNELKWRFVDVTTSLDQALDFLNRARETQWPKKYRIIQQMTIDTVIKEV